MVRKIISGGQTGVDQGALDFALLNGIVAGGWCPKGRICEDGIIPDKYPLVEVGIGEYNLRTLWNVRDSDGTLILIRKGFMEKGTELTVDYCKQSGKPFFLLDTYSLSEKDETVKNKFTRWLEDHSIVILNVAGNRESTSPGIQSDTIRLLEFLLNA